MIRDDDALFAAALAILLACLLLAVPAYLADQRQHAAERTWTR